MHLSTERFSAKDRHQTVVGRRLPAQPIEASPCRPAKYFGETLKNDFVLSRPRCERCYVQDAVRRRIFDLDGDRSIYSPFMKTGPQMARFHVNPLEAVRVECALNASDPSLAVPFENDSALKDMLSHFAFRPLDIASSKR